MGFHSPSDAEFAFLIVVTLGYPELQMQTNSCEVEYDPTGYLDVRVLAGPKWLGEKMCDGPSLFDGTLVDTILWVGEDGYLDSIEIVSYAIEPDYGYDRFIKPANAPKLRYKYPGAPTVS